MKEGGEYVLSKSGPTPPAWPVNCELFFYLAFPFLVHRAGLAAGSWKGFGKTIGKLVSLEFVFVAIWFGVVFAFSHYSLSKEQVPSLANALGVTSVFPTIRIFDFAIGVCAAQFYLATRNTPPKSPRWAYRVGNVAVLLVVGLNCLPFPMTVGTGPADALLI
jgi:peptidoglycan/LPS O-acetylase OafA/YrhL